MTRGTPYLILKNKVVYSEEFNGDMYGSPKDIKELQETGHYPEMINRLAKVKDEKDFKTQIKEFNKQNHNYENFKFFIDKIKNLDMSKDYFENFFSDYLFFKNCSDKTEILIDKNGKQIEIGKGQIATFNFGNLIEVI